MSAWVILGGLALYFLTRSKSSAGAGEGGGGETFPPMAVGLTLEEAARIPGALIYRDGTKIIRVRFPYEGGWAEVVA